MSDLTEPRFETQTSRTRDKRVAVRPSGRSEFVTVSQIYFNYLDRINAL